MRNLKKILALVLALVMSMSLVVTANAFEDTADVEFKEAIDVLSGLEVFQGRTETEFAPKASITRAEVAAIIYRIVTSDVENKQVGIYADYNKFDDVKSTNWFAGYVNYCANAEYIKGYDAKTFGPNDPVTGYQALAMILRAVGYGKNGEFSGTGWEVRTASVAKSLGITDNILDGSLGQPATRETVAEILFRAILVPTVTWNMAFGYQETNTTLGYEAFGLECIEGVVVANEFANLYGTSVLGTGKTHLETENEVRTLAIGSELTDIGESRYAYVVGTKVLALGNTGSNVVFETGDASTVSKYVASNGLSTNGTEYYENFGHEGYYTSDWRIEYVLTFANIDAVEAFEKEFGVELGTALTYNKVLKVEQPITANDMGIIKGIFYVADNDADGIEVGEVYVATKSETKNDDISDKISYKTFVKEYINDEAFAQTFKTTDNGEWLKVVDNDNDGDAEYVFLTTYTLDQAIDTFTKKDVTYLQYNALDVIDDVDAYYVDEIEVGDVVLYTVIDGQAIIEKANSEEATIKEVSFKNETLTTEADATYGQSGIENATGMDELVVNVDEDVDYTLYFDKYGFVRAYNDNAGTQYGLLTELYANYKNNQQIITKRDLIAELTVGDADTEEYDVLNKTPYNVFEIGSNAQDLLQVATDHLGLKTEGSEFDNVWTNIAKFVMTDDGVKLNSAAEYAYNTKGQQLYYELGSNTKKAPAKDAKADMTRPVYAVDYIELDDTQDIAKKDVHFDIANSPDYVNAVHDTEFYVVHTNSNNRTSVMYFTDYVNVAAIDNEYITGAYAVAKNTSASKDEADYWVADVIVIEVNNWDVDYDSIGLAYYNSKQHKGEVKQLETLNNETESVEQSMVPGTEAWGAQWDDYGFYRLYNTEALESGVLSAEDIEVITSNWNAHGIYAGYIERMNNLTTRGGYIDVNIGPDANGNARIVRVDNAPVYTVGSVNGSTKYSVDTLHMSNDKHSQVNKGDAVIWVTDADGNVAYIIDLTYATSTWAAASWLYQGEAMPIAADAADVYPIFSYIIAEQVYVDYSYRDAEALARNALAMPETTDAEKAAKLNALDKALKALNAINPDKLSREDYAEWVGLKNEVETTYNELKAAIEGAANLDTIVEELIAKNTAYQTAASADKKATGEALATALLNYLNNEDQMTPAQKTLANDAKVAASTYINGLIRPVTTATTWTDIRTENDKALALTADQIAAYDKLNPVTAPAKTLAETVEDVKAQFAEAEANINLINDLRSAHKNWNGDQNQWTESALRSAYEACLAKFGDSYDIPWTLLADRSSAYTAYTTAWVAAKGLFTADYQAKVNAAIAALNGNKGKWTSYTGAGLTNKQIEDEIMRQVNAILAATPAAAGVTVEFHPNGKPVAPAAGSKDAVVGFNLVLVAGTVKDATSVINHSLKVTNNWSVEAIKATIETIVKANTQLGAGTDEVTGAAYIKSGITLNFGSALTDVTVTVSAPNGTAQGTRYDVHVTAKFGTEDIVVDTYSSFK